MEQIQNSTKSVKTLLVIFVSILLLSFHYYFVYFINSTFLAKYVGENAVGYLYTLGALLNIGFFLFTPKLLRKFGNYKLILSLTLLEICALVGLGLTTSPLLIICLFIVQTATPSVILYCMDMFIEHYTARETKGTFRGIYLTMNNIPPVITPFIVGLILTKPDYWKVYLISAAFLVPFLILIVSRFKKFEDPAYSIVPTKEVVSSFYNNKNIFDIFLDNFLLNFFYAWMVIYMPIYLHQHIGFDWPQIGLMFSIMILPFILFQFPVGKIEDKLHDEKQILIIGFGIMALSAMTIPFLRDANFLLWTTVLFISRIGASIVEVSCESYFFKHVSPDNAEYISFYRANRSLPFIILPAIVSLSFLVVGFGYSFMILGLFMLLGIRYAFLLKDK